MFYWNNQLSYILEFWIQSANPWAGAGVPGAGVPGAGVCLRMNPYIIFGCFVIRSER